MSDGIVESPTLGHQGREAAVGRRKVGIDVQRFLVMGDGFVKAPARGQHDPEVAVGVRVVGGDFQGRGEVLQAISAETAYVLGTFFGMSPQFWANLQSQHDLRRIEVEQASRIRARVRPLSV